MKNIKNNLEFIPSQSFESDKIAKDYAALLALWHFQKTLPLERKIPEPFASTWLQMVTAEKNEKNSNVVSKFSKKITTTVAGDNLVGEKMDRLSDIVLSDLNIDKGKKMDDTDCNKEKKNDSNTENNLDNKRDKKIEKFKENYSKNHKKKGSEPAEKVLDKATSDWLCDNCDAQNFAKLLSGILRLKCFKCNTVRGNSGVLVLSVAEVR